MAEITQIRSCSGKIKETNGLFRGRGAPKSHEILMFVCLQKETRQGSDVTKPVTSPMSTIDHRDIITLSGVFWRETNIKIS